MTREESAVLQLKRLGDLYRVTDFYGDPVDTYDLEEAVDTALDALEKEMAKPYRLQIDTAVCPACGHPVEMQHMNGEILIHDFFDYCPSCGQAIDWEEDYA